MLPHLLVIWKFHMNKGSDLETIQGDRNGLVVQSVHKAAPNGDSTDQEINLRPNLRRGRRRGRVSSERQWRSTVKADHPWYRYMVGMICVCECVFGHAHDLTKNGGPNFEFAMTHRYHSSYVS